MAEIRFFLQKSMVKSAMMSPLPFISWPCAALPVVVVAGRFALDDRAHEIRYRHKTHALHLHEVSGCLRRESGEERFRSGDLLFSRADETTTYAQDGPQRLWCVHFEPARAAASAVELPRSVSLGAMRGYFVERLANLARAHHSAHANVKNPAIAAQASAILLEVLMLAAQLAKAGGSPARRCDEAVWSIASHLQAQPCDLIDVTKLAKRSGMTQPYLARRFRERFGMTMQRYQLACRIDQARHLLTSTDLTVGELARQLGFGDAQHFSKRFVQVVGMTPGRYRAAKP